MGARHVRWKWWSDWLGLNTVHIHVLSGYAATWQAIHGVAWGPPPTLPTSATTATFIRPPPPQPTCLW